MPTLLDMIRDPARSFKRTTRGDRIRLAAIMFMQLGFVGALGYALLNQLWLTAFVACVGLLSVWVPPILARNWRVHFPLEFELLLNVFIYASIFLGEIQGYYTRFWWWDSVLHFSSGLVLGMVGFLIMYALYQSGRLRTHPFILSLFAFCFALSLGALWEIFEFAMDQLFGTTMQKPMLGDSSGLTDTMFDLILDALGALVVSVSGYFYVRHKHSGWGIFEHFVHAYFERRHTRRDQS